MFLVRVEAAVSVSQVQQAIHKFLNKFFKKYNLPTPRIKIVNNSTEKWLGRTIYNPSQDTNNTTIEVQKSITNDEKTLDRIIAHELIHHWEFCVQQSNKHHEAHGSEFKNWARIINNVMGKDYVTMVSDTTYVQEIDNEYYLLITEISHDRYGWAWSAYPNSKQKDEVRKRVHDGKTKLFKSKDTRFVGGVKISAGGWLSIPKDKDIMQALKEIFTHGKSILNV